MRKPVNKTQIEPPATIPCPTVSTEPRVASNPDLLAQRAEQLDDRLFPAFLFATLKSSVGGMIDSEVYRAWVKKQLSESGNPRDPVERMLVEQLILAHQHICILTTRSTTSKSASETAAYATAAARLQAEIRRTALALKEYRLAAGGRSLKVMSSDDQAPAQSAG